jgi:hypothetical protein
MIISDPTTIRDLQLKEDAERRNSAVQNFRTMTPDEVKAAGLNPAQKYQVNQAGKIEAIGGGPAPVVSPNRPPQIRSALDALRNIRKLAEEPLSVGEMAGRLRDTPVVGAIVGQNRADLTAALSQVEGSLIQDQLGELAKLNPGGVASLANSETEARRLASSIANLDPNQSLEQFLTGVGRAETYFNRQLEMTGEKPVSSADQGRAVTAPGTASGVVMGAIQGGEPIMTPEDEAAGQAIQQAWDATGRFDEVARVAEQFGRSFGEKEAAFLRANEGRPVKITPNPTGMPTQAEQAVGEFVSTPGGEMASAGMLGSANAMTFGMLDELAPILGLDSDRVQMAKRYLQERNPGTSFAGEVAGSILPGGAVSRGVNTMLEGTRFAGISPLAGDTIAGMLAGGGEANENRLGGIIGGGALAAGGGALGRRMFGGDVPPGPDVMPPAGGPMGGMGGPSGGRASGGAAATPDDVIRVSRAQELPVPVNLANFQKTRRFEDMQRARELAKSNEVGGPIRERMAQQQRQIASNFDSFLEDTGAEVLGNLEEQGIRITAGLQKMADQSKAKYRALYKRAEKAGELREPVSYQPVLDYIASKVPTEQQEKVMRIAREALEISDPDGTGVVSINALEGVRKKVGRASQSDPTQGFFGGELKGAIDGVLNDAGGDVYRASRGAFRDHQEKFKDVGLIAQLLGTKRNSIDRVVAAENVTARLMSPSTSADGLRRMRDLLEGEGGDPQAWKEVQGAVMERIQRAAYPRSAVKDEAGNVTVSPAGLARAVSKLDEAGKLKVIFDGGIAQGLRTLSDVAQDVFTAPPGSLNTSNTSSAWMNALDMIINTVVAGLPLPAGVMTNVVAPVRKSIRENPVRQEVQQLLGDNIL